MYDDAEEYTSAQRLDTTQVRFAEGAGGGYSAAPLDTSTAAAVTTSSAAAAAAAAATSGAPRLLVLAGQRSADLAPICRALQGAGAAGAAAGQATAAFADLTMSDAELVHPERHSGFAALVKSGALKAKKKKKKKKKKGEEGAPERAAMVLIAFDSAGERLPLLGQYGKLEKLHAALLKAGVAPQCIAFAGTREALPEAQIFASPGNSGLAPGFVQRLGEVQLAELRRHGHVPSRFVLWKSEATPAQVATLRAWLA